MTSLPLAHSTGAVLMAKDFWDRIPPDLRKMVKEEFRQAMARLTSELRKQTAESIGLIEKSGLTVLPMPDKADRMLQ